MRKGLLFALAALPAGAAAFFDPFDGSSLGAHWSTYSEGSNWVHSVGGGVLTVTELNGPFDFDEFNIYAAVEGHADFYAETRVMWDGSAHQTFSFGLAQIFPQSPLIGRVWYSISPGSSATVNAFLNSGGSGSVAAPAANEWHTFAMRRTGSTLEAFLDGSLLGSTNSAVADAANRVFLHFGGPETADFGQIQVDYVNVVPEPTALAVLGLGATVLLRRRRAQFTGR
jgi:hypothetical protein